MITISLKNGDNTSQHTFTKPRIVIGASQEADLHLEAPNIETELVVILMEKGTYKAVNVNNDPYLTLNTLPFGKRSLKQGDLLSFYSLDLKISQLELNKAPTHRLLPHLNKPHKAENAPPVAHESLFEDKPEKTSDDSSIPFPFPSSWQLQQTEEDQTEEDQEEIPLVAIRAGTQEIEELLQQQIEEEIEETPLPRRPSQMKWGLMFALVALAATIIVGIFLNFPRDINDLQVNHTALAVSDVGMALLYAQMNNLDPKKVDWTSPDSVDKLVKYVLFPKYPSAVQQEGSDILTAGDHLIEVYSSEKGGRFLIIARPETSGWLRWWQANPSILLDSKDLQLRKIKDIKPYQRLLAINPRLTQENLRWLTSLIDQEEIITFTSLVEEGQEEFALPVMLSDTSPHEDYIYNLPRYSPFTDHLVRKLIRQKGHIGGTADGRYEKKLKEYLELKNLIFYTSQDLGKVINVISNFDLGTDPLHVIKISAEGAPVAEAMIVPLHGQM